MSHADTNSIEEGPERESGRLHVFYAGTEPADPQESLSQVEALEGWREFVVRLGNLPTSDDPVEACARALRGPILVGEHVPDGISSPASSELPEITSTRVSALRFQHSNVFCLTFDGELEGLARLVGLLRLDPEALRFDGEALPEACAVAQGSVPSGLDPDVRFLLIAQSGMEPGPAPSDQPGLGETLLEDPDEVVRRHVGSGDSVTTVAVGPDITLLSSAPAGPLERWGLWSSVVLAAARTQLLHLRQKAFEQPTGDDLSLLETRLLLVEASLEISSLAPAPLAQCHRAAAEMRGLPDSARVIARMLDSLHRVNEAPWLASRS